MKISEIADRLAEFELECIPFPPFVEAKDAIEANLEYFRLSKLAKHILVLGESGTGKTTLCNWLASQSPKIQRPDGDHIPILRVEVPPAATVKGIADAFLVALGDPLPTHGTITSKTARIVILCKNCGVELMLIDECQHLQDRGDTRTQYLVGDWFKHLIDKIAVPTVMLGLPRLQNLLQTNEQLRRRFSRTKRLRLGESDTTSVEDECLMLFYSLGQELRMPLRAEPFDPQEMGQRLFYACGARVAYIKKIMFGAYRQALEQDIDVIDAPLLQQAFIDEVWPQGIGKLNPFHPDFEFRWLDRGGEPFEVLEHGPSRRRR
jgi:energy-coupling factor transporter ATP-binding protein EcfA2